ncbi:MAG: DNA starvation/stationary phase protection protein [Pseudomonadota bacterium]
MLQTAETLSSDVKADLVDGLNQVVAEVVVTTMLAQNFHWNVKGMAFGPLHALFQEIYEDHFTAQDEVAERLKAVGGHAEGRLAEMVSRSKVAEHDGHTDAETMVRLLADAQRVVASTMAGVATIADANGDQATHDLLVGRQITHEKFAWILEAHLD